MRPCLFALLVAVATPAVGQELPDAGLPDASVGMSGADRDTEEADPQGGPCLGPNDCAQGLTCQAQRCVPVKPVTVGCGSAPGGVLLLGLSALLRLKRR
jgi:hypothetical protein